MRLKVQEEEEVGVAPEVNPLSLMIGMIPTGRDRLEITEELAGDTHHIILEMGIKKVKMLMMMIKKTSNESLSQNIMIAQAFIVVLQKMLSAAKKMEIKIQKPMIQIKEKYFLSEYL
jgi:hypothetical protein